MAGKVVLSPDFKNGQKSPGRHEYSLERVNGTADGKTHWGLSACVMETICIPHASSNHVLCIPESCKAEYVLASLVGAANNKQANASIVAQKEEEENRQRVHRL